MHSRNRFFPPRRVREQGVAIVIMLALLVLLTGVVIAFFARAVADRQVSNSGANQVKADTLARGALDVITGDLKQEMALGSKIYTVNGVTIYKPISNTYIVPTRSYPGYGASSDPVPNLIRESGTSNAAVTVNATNVGVGGGVSAASSTTASVNGRKIGLARWNSHYLVPRVIVSGAPVNATSTSIDSTPVSGFTAPSWVPVTNQGPAALGAPSPSVIGRYAYAIYDEGGLLDANVAGYPTAMTAAQLGEKGLLAFADLTQLPAYNPAGVPSLPTYLPQTQVNNLVGWRNYASAQPAGTLGTGYTFNTSAATRYLNFLLGSTGGFLTVNPLPTPFPATAASRTDQAFTSRQALLRFWETLIANANGGTMTDTAHLQDVLPYLGTFSRELNAPSWSPANPDLTANPYASIKYGDLADSPGNINRDIPNVRFPGSVTLTRYRIDGTSYTKQVQAGDAIVQMRFPLGRIAWLTLTNDNVTFSPGPKSGIPPAAIKQHFGLLWDSTNLRWEYVSPTGPTTTGNPATAIKTLDQVAQEGREPDFFELLKAGILSGSVGKTAADPTAPSPHYKSGVFTWLDTARDDVNGDLQLLRIGANIIDQASPSQIPTDIRFGNNEVSPTIVVDAIGTKSLPYVTWIPYITHRPEKYAARNMVGAYFGFEVWDPHQNATVTAPAGSPTNFRIRPTQGKAQLGIFQKTAATGTTYPPTTPPYVALDTTSYISFTRDATASRTFSDPTVLSPAFSTATGPNDSCPITLPPTISGSTTTAPTAQQGNPGFVGFNAGLFDLHDQRITGSTNDLMLNNSRITIPVTPADWPSFDVQVLDPLTGSWRTYQQITYMIGGDPGSEVTTWNVAFQLLATQISMYNPDPRTERFGAFGGHGISSMGLVWTGTALSGAVQQYGANIGSGIQGNFGGGVGWLPAASAVGYPSRTEGWPNTALACLSLNNMANSGSGNLWAAYYDPDGIMREGDGTGNGTIARARYPMIPNTGSATTTRIGDRPLILNRPYRSVGELGYAFRDMPWKTLDLFTKNSADSALLDLFTTSDADMTAGKFNLNTRNSPVLQAMLASAITTELPPLGGAAQLVLSAVPAVNAQAAIIAGGLVSATANPLLNRADLVPTTASVIASLIASAKLSAPTTNSVINWDVKTQREVPIRALAESGGTRTWNLLIDMVAQAGRYPPGVTTLDKFNVEGERRYWLHVAIDRFTGQIIDKQLESVYE